MYSSIVRRGCKANCGRMPDMGGKGWCFVCKPEYKQEIIDKSKKRNAIRSTGTKVRNLVNDNLDIKAPKDYRSKSQLLKDADRLFADYLNFLH